MLINRTHLAYDGPNYYNHKKKPFVVASYDPRPNEFHGFRLVQIIEHLQHELNAKRNQRMDNVTLALYHMWKVKKDSGIDAEDIVVQPNGIIWVADNDDVEELKLTDVTSSSYSEEDKLKQDIEQVTGTPSVVRGNDTARKETATESSIKADSASIRFETKIQLFETVGLKRMAQLMDANNKQFVDTNKVIRIAGDNGGYEWPVIAPEELQGKFDYLPAASNVDPMVSKIAKRSQFIELMNVTANNPFINQQKLTEKLLETYDIKNPEELMVQPQVPQMPPNELPPTAQPEQVPPELDQLGGDQVGQDGAIPTV
jgi:hypothetical protein